MHSAAEIGQARSDRGKETSATAWLLIRIVRWSHISNPNPNLKKTQNCTYSTTNLFESDLEFKCNTNRSNQMDGEKWYREYMYAIYDYNSAERQLGRGVIFVGGFFLLFEVKNETMIRFSPSKLLLVKVVFWFLELSKAAQGGRTLQCRPCALSGKNRLFENIMVSKNKNLLYSNIRFL